MYQTDDVYLNIGWKRPTSFPSIVFSFPWLLANTYFFKLTFGFCVKAPGKWEARWWKSTTLALREIKITGFDYWLQSTFFSIKVQIFFMSSADVLWISCCSCTKFPRFSRLKAILLFHGYDFNLFSLFSQDEIKQNTLLSLQSLAETLTFHPLQHLCPACILWFLAEFFICYLCIWCLHMCVGHVMYAHVCGCMGVTVLRPEVDVGVSLCCPLPWDRVTH